MDPACRSDPLPVEVPLPPVYPVPPPPVPAPLKPADLFSSSAKDKDGQVVFFTRPDVKKYALDLFPSLLGPHTQRLKGSFAPSDIDYVQRRLATLLAAYWFGTAWENREDLNVLFTSQGSAISTIVASLTVALKQRLPNDSAPGTPQFADEFAGYSLPDDLDPWNTPSVDARVQDNTDTILDVEVRVEDLSVRVTLLELSLTYPSASASKRSRQAQPMPDPVPELSRDDVPLVANIESVVLAYLCRWGRPVDVLTIRREAFPAKPVPAASDLNRTLHRMKAEGVVDLHPPPLNGPNKRPLWAPLVRSCV